MEITGKIIQILPEETGEGRNGPWKKQNFILETQEQYPKKVCITVWGDKIDLNSFGENSMVTASINIESREYNSRWYTDVKAWRIVNAQESPSVPPEYNQVPSSDEIPPDSSDDINDLPF
ncbi:MAG: DUF3127 domain-containing protein [Bacteroidetes bacterium]|nr:DUF3127 domain-containing protein [Bacteroidota bacterium]